ncbi:MAG: hypothetical protein ACC662_01535 [Planctomycetota bacterium]
MTWARRHYRGHKVWILVGEDGAPVCDERGLVPMRYRPDDSRTYTVRPAEILPLETAPAGEGEAAPPPVEAWLGSSSRGNETGLGVVLRWRDAYREFGRRAEGRAAAAPWLAAATQALDAIRRTDLPVVLHLPGAEGLASLLAAAEPRTGTLGRLVHAVERFADVRFEEAGDAGEARRAAALAREALRPSE